MKHDSVSLYHEVVHILLRQLGVDKCQCHIDARLEQDLGADSLDLRELELELDKEFNLCLPRDFCEDAETVWGLTYNIGQKIGLEACRVSIEKAIADKTPLKPSQRSSNETSSSSNTIASRGDEDISKEGDDALESVSHPLTKVYTLQELVALSKDYELFIQIVDGVTTIMFQEIEYVIKDDKSLTKFIAAVKLLSEFKQLN